MAEECKCPIEPHMDEEQLRQIVRDRKMCTDVPGKRWMCPNLDRELVRAHKESYWKRSKTRKLKKAGYTDDQIKQMPNSSRRYKATIVVDLDLINV